MKKYILAIPSKNTVLVSKSIIFGETSTHSVYKLLKGFGNIIIRISSLKIDQDSIVIGIQDTELNASDMDFDGMLLALGIDETVEPKDQSRFEDFLHTLNPTGLPPYKLVLKQNCPIILLRNLNPSEGLGNGTRLICSDFKTHIISAKIASGDFKGQTIDSVGIYLREPVFSHGQLYVALSRAKSSGRVKMLIQPATVDDPDDHSTYNIVYNEIIHKAFS
ncbi:uncharacterized protein LOC132630219 [Lycium barbarum]|uniref:uncharacterized protein LOC132630219 n=1 Tax=Lycium barbarum TaxID=112863 RepID=UPI00293E4521|nr:uncharacterized protein LOC132630219 [Lycium barbarum]